MQKHKYRTVTGIIIFRHSHNELIQLLRLIQTYAYSNLYLFETPVGDTDLVLIRNLYLFRTST